MSTSKVLHRCKRCLKDQLYRDYHDNERWVPVYDDLKHFEFLLLETFQAWLSRYTILKKRENFREAFDQFDPQIIAWYDTAKIEELMSNSGIVRNKLKIYSSITNAKIFLDIQKQWWSRNNFIRNYTNHSIINNTITWMQDHISSSPLSDRISRDLKKRGMKFVWSKIIYAHLQATGQINDHENICWKK
jgi:DNA-3-methyladenine glycosylase I